MQNLVFSLFINGLMAALLLATMIYCRKLDGRIKILQDSKSELATIIKEFDESTQRATKSIADIHLATNRLSENIQHKIDKANFLADDLQYMIEKGQKMSGKVDAGPVTRLAPTPPAPEPKPQPRAAAPSTAFIMPDAPDAADAASARPTRIRSRAEQEIMSALSTKNTNRE